MHTLNLDREQIAVLRTLYTVGTPVGWTEIAQTTWEQEDKNKFIGYADGLSALGLVKRTDPEGDWPHYQLNKVGKKVVEALTATNQRQEL